MRNESPGSGDADPVPAEKKNIDTIPDRGWFFLSFPVGGGWDKMLKNSFFRDYPSLFILSRLYIKENNGHKH